MIKLPLAQNVEAVDSRLLAELRLPLLLSRYTTLTTRIPFEAKRRQPSRPLHRHTLVGLAAVELLLAHTLVVDPPAQPRVLGLALRYVAVAVLCLVGHQARELRLKAAPAVES